MILVYSGQVSDREMLDVRATFGNDSPEMQKCRFLLVDLTDAALAQISTDALKELAGLHNVLAEHTFTGMPVAIVAPRDVEYGLSRMWQVFVEENGWETMVFRSRTEAERWLQQRLTQTCGADTCRLKRNEPLVNPALQPTGTDQNVRPERSEPRDECILITRLVIGQRI